MQTQVTVNINRLFAKVQRYFGSPESSLTEAVQNAYRSTLPHDPARGLPNIYITVTGADVRIVDDGRGIADPLAMLSLASSDWNDDVEHDQDPAGLGVCGILAFCEQATWTSKFGSVTVSGDLFFNDAGYRETMGSRVCPEDARETGTVLLMSGFKGDVSEQAITKLFGYYHSVNIYYNNAPLRRTQLHPVVGTVGTSSTVHSNLTNESRWGFPAQGNAQIWCVWHGHHIPATGFSPPTISLPVGDAAGQGVVDLRPILHYDHVRGGLMIDINVLDENVVTPKLPDRTSLTLDARTVTFLEAAWRTAVLAYHKKLSTKLMGPPLTVQDLKNIRVAPIGVSGWATAVLDLVPYTIQETCQLRSSQRCYNNWHKSYALVRHVTAGRMYAKEDVVLLMGDRVCADECVDEPHGLLFDHGHADPLSDIDVFPGDANFTLIIDAGKDTVRPAEGQTPHIECTLAYYLVPTEAFIKYATAEEMRAAYAQYALDIDGKYDVVLCSRYIDSSSLAESFISLAEDGGTLDDAVDGLRDVFTSYTDAEELDSSDRDQVMDDFDTMWDTERARWAGKLHLNGSISSLSYMIPGHPTRFTIDTKDKTVTLPDGTVHNITW